MKQSVYLETSVISYYANKPSRDLVVAARQQETHEWWQEHINKELPPYQQRQPPDSHRTHDQEAR